MVMLTNPQSSPTLEGAISESIKRLNKINRTNSEGDSKSRAIGILTGRESEFPPTAAIGIISDSRPLVAV